MISEKRREDLLRVLSQVSDILGRTRLLISDETSEIPCGWTEFLLMQTEMRHLQGFLLKQGIDPGPIDGVWGPRTAAALAVYHDQRFCKVNWLDFRRRMEKAIADISEGLRRGSMDVEQAKDILMKAWVDEKEPL